MTELVETATSGGRIRCSDATYLTAARGAGSLNASTIASAHFVGQSELSSSFICSEVFGKIDISSIPQGATVSSLDIELYFDSFGGTDGDTFRIAEYDWSPALITNDFRPSNFGAPDLNDLVTNNLTLGELLNSGLSIDTHYSMNLTATDMVGAAPLQTAINNGDSDFYFILFSEEHQDENSPAVSTDRGASVLTGGANATRFTINYQVLNAANSLLIGAVF